MYMQFYLFEPLDMHIKLKMMTKKIRPDSIEKHPDEREKHP